MQVYEASLSLAMVSVHRSTPTHISRSQRDYLVTFDLTDLHSVQAGLKWPIIEGHSKNLDEISALCVWLNEI